MEVTEAGRMADPKVLEAIDKLFELNIGEYVALPQILVVGDQSSAKSSVLEGLTGFPYPRDSVLCTRFATHITFRRASAKRIRVSVLPAVDAKPEHDEKLRKWSKQDLESLDSDTFTEILKEVYDLMGIGSPIGKVTFSSDVLSIEICGPEEQHYSVIDVPGIFRNTTSGVTTKADIDTVRKMVSGYMENPRSAMLAVIPANVDIATQDILEMAKEYDPKGLRTLGVLTKPDLVDRGAEHDIFDIVEGRSHGLYLGWCIVRNLSQEHLENSSVNRQTQEKNFFATVDPWKKLPKDRVGVDALRTRLVDLLGELIRREFPNVKSDINKRSKSCRDELVALGPPRETKDEQYKYLLALASRYQAITDQALTSRYNDSVFDKDDGLRLATMVTRRNDDFATDLHDKGHTYKFKVEVQAAEDVATSEDDVKFECRYWEEDTELEDLMKEDCEINEPRSNGIKLWLDSIYQNSRGFALGTFDASLLTVAWRKQSINWDGLALGYIYDIVSMVHACTVSLLSTICTDERIRRGLLSVLLDSLLERYAKGIAQAKFLLSVERAGTPLTANHYFAENLEKCRQQRIKTMMLKNAFTVNGHGTVVKIANTYQSANTSSNSDYTVCDLHDILQSYYKVARKRFVDNVCMQAADYHLVTGPDAPIRVFSPAFVSELTAEQLDTIAAESVVTRRKRADLRRKVESLEKGKKLL